MRSVRSRLCGDQLQQVSPLPTDLWQILVFTRPLLFSLLNKQLPAEVTHTHTLDVYTQINLQSALRKPLNRKSHTEAAGCTKLFSSGELDAFYNKPSRVQQTERPDSR